MVAQPSTTSSGYHTPPAPSPGDHSHLPVKPAILPHIKYEKSVSSLNFEPAATVYVNPVVPLCLRDLEEWYSKSQDNLRKKYPNIPAGVTEPGSREELEGQAYWREMEIVRREYKQKLHSIHESYFLRFNDQRPKRTPLVGGVAILIQRLKLLAFTLLCRKPTHARPGSTGEFQRCFPNP